MIRRLLAVILAASLVEAPAAHALGDAVVVISQSPGAVMTPKIGGATFGTARFTQPTSNSAPIRTIPGDSIFKRRAFGIPLPLGEAHPTSNTGEGETFTATARPISPVPPSVNGRGETGENVASVAVPDTFEAAERAEGRISQAFAALPFRTAALSGRNGFTPQQHGADDAWKPVTGSPDTRNPAPDTAVHKKKSLRNILRGTAVYKLGMDSMAVAVPLALHSATWIAVFVAVWNISQAVSSSGSDGLFKRYEPQKVMTGALALQAAAVGGMFLLMTAQLFTPAFVLPLYAVAGLAQGVVETARRVMPRAVIGPDRGKIEDFNSRTHMSYEGAGVVGAVGAGAIVAAFGLQAALLVNPIAYLVSALVFKGVTPNYKWQPEEQTTLAPPAPLPQAGEGSRLRGWFNGYKKAGAKIWHTPELRVMALALLIPQVMHRVLEGFAFPLYAKSVLADPARTGWLLGASNVGELIGALALLKIVFARDSGSRTWVRVTALATLGFWLMAFSAPWALLVPFIAIQSTAWAGSDLKIASKFQSRADVTPREIGFLFGAYLLGVTIISLGLGAFFDAFGTGAGFIALNVLLTAAAGWLFFKNGLGKKNAG